MLSIFVKRSAAAALAGAMALSLLAPAFAAPLPVLSGIASRDAIVGTAGNGAQPTQIRYRRYNNGGAGAALALGVLGLGVAGIIASQNYQDRNDYYDQPHYAPAYQPQYAPVYEPQYAPSYEPQYAPVYQGDGYPRHRSYGNGRSYYLHPRGSVDQYHNNH